MKTVLSDGRVFETLPFLKIEYNEEESVYKYTFETVDRIVKSSAGHMWGVWDRETKEVTMKRMDTIKIGCDELLIQSWK